jgi:hypothetical protein
MRQGDRFFQDLSAALAHAVGLSVWHVLQELGI